jgi:hypothetical protein
LEQCRHVVNDLLQRAPGHQICDRNGYVRLHLWAKLAGTLDERVVYMRHLPVLYHVYGELDWVVRKGQRPFMAGCCSLSGEPSGFEVEADVAHFIDTPVLLCVH